jgi:hypothetical protein
VFLLSKKPKKVPFSFSFGRVAVFCEERAGLVVPDGSLRPNFIFSVQSVALDKREKSENVRKGNGGGGVGEERGWGVGFTTLLRTWPP